MASKSSSKRTIDDIDDYCDLKEQESANVHGLLCTLSPVKKGRKASYFDGCVSDGTSQMRVVGFRADQRKKLLDLSEKGESVLFKDCQIKLSRQGHEMEVLLKNSTKISASEKSFDITESEDKPIALVEAHNLPEYSRVTVLVKVVSKRKAVKLDSGLTKQEVVVADASAVMSVTLWEDRVDSLEVARCYKLNQFVIRKYNMKKSLSLSKQGSTIEFFEDIGEVVTNEESEVIDTIYDAEIVGVKELGSFHACGVCKARVEPLTPPGGCCSRSECAMYQRMDRCNTQVSSLLHIQHGKTKCKQSISL